MADSTYDIIECRWVVKPEWTEIYILITDSSDGMPVGGWYKTVVSKDTPAIPYIEKAIRESAFFSWDRGVPGA